GGGGGGARRAGRTGGARRAGRTGAARGARGAGAARPVAAAGEEPAVASLPEWDQSSGLGGGVLRFRTGRPALLHERADVGRKGVAPDPVDGLAKRLTVLAQRFP